MTLFVKKARLLTALFLVVLPAVSIAISLSGTFQAWLVSADPTISTTYESAGDQAIMDVTATSGRIWRLDVQKNDSFWSSDFHLYCRRTSSGYGGIILGGTSYQEIAASGQSFFWGWGDVQDIEIQMRLTMSSSTEPDTYATTVVYTVVSF